MAGPWSAGRLVGLLADLRATSRSHSSLFTLHSSLFTDFEREWVPVWLGPGRLVGWWGCSLISARPRDHTLHSSLSLFTLRVQKGTGTHRRLAWRAGEPPPPQRPSPQNLATRRSHVTHPSLFTLHSSLFTLQISRERGSLYAMNLVVRTNLVIKASWRRAPPPAAVQVPGRGGRAGATLVLLTFAQKYVCRLDRDQKVSIRVARSHRIDFGKLL